MPEKKQFANKAAIVTGGANGIGRATVEEFVKHGACVTFADISDDGKKLEKELLRKGGNVQFVQGDMGQEEFCRKLAEEAIKKWGKVNFLVNNAFSFIGKGLDVTREDWHRVMDTGPVAFATMAQAVFKSMKAQGGGAIVNISSISAHAAQPNRWTYCSAKAAVNQLTRCMALDLAAYNIRVNTVSPGWVWTRVVEEAAKYDREKWGPIWGKYHMMRRLGEPAEIAAAIIFLCSDKASFITAAELPVDGGYLGMGSEGLGETSDFSGGTKFVDSRKQ